MKRSLLIHTFLILLTQFATGQTVLLTEDFETDGEGSRYTSNTFNISNSDYFVRYQDGDPPAMTNDPTGESGTFYWVGEDCDNALGGTGILTLNSVSIAGFNVEIRALLAIGRDGGDRFESGDELLFQYNIDGGGWNTSGAFYGGFGATSSSPTEDTDLDGTADGPSVLNNAFTEYIFAIPATGTNMQIRFIMGQDQGTEELAVDNIRVITTSPLPIELFGFSLQETEKGEVEINWQTASEQNNDYFTVERSADASVWENIEKVNGKGNYNGTTQYRIIDHHPYEQSSYYRIKQTDFDGRFSYSKVKSIQLRNHRAVPISIYPNPSSQVITVEGMETELKELQFFNSIGQNISKLIEIQSISPSQLKLNISNLPTGIYYLDTKTIVRKIQIIRTP